METLESDVDMVPADEASSNAAPSSSTKKPKRFEIEKWNAVAFWAWDGAVDNCGICKSSIMDKCLNCETNEECPSSLGLCNHSFHSHCINKWLKTHDICPMDGTPFQLQNHGH